MFLVVMSAILQMVVGCSKNDDKDIVVPEIALNKNELVLEKGKTERLIASFTPAETPDKGHVWSSSAPGVALVDETGMVTAVEPGEAVITATALVGKKKATCRITVVDKVVKVTGVSVKPAEAKMVAGDELTLEAIVTPENATNKSVVWTSGDGKIATVDAAGKVTAIAEGKVAIKATTKDGDKTASCQITVVNKGVEISAPTVSDITSISALVTGTVKPFGVKLGEIGICYSTAQSPTVEDKKIALSDENISYTLTKLEASTTYYVRVYATVDGVTKYGDQAMFTTEVAVDISDPQISSITKSSAYIAGTITTYGLQTEEVGICYATSSMPTVSNTKVTLSGNAIGYTLNELKPETTYYVRIFAKLNGKYYYGEQSEFATTGIIKTHFEAMDIYEGALAFVSVAPSGISEVDVCYGTSPNPTITDNIVKATLGAGGKLYLKLSGLRSGVTYYVRTYSLNGSKVEYHDDEVSGQTIGRDFSIELKLDGYKEYAVDYGFRYSVFYTYTYNIKPVGTYLAKVYNFGSASIAKEINYAESFYLKNGEGTIKLKQDGGVLDYAGASTFVHFSHTTGELRFTNTESNICYHLSLPNDTYIRTY